MTAAERQLLAAISRRAEALKRYADIALRDDVLISHILGLMAGNLTRTLFVVCGEAMREDFLRWMLFTLRETSGLCLCGGAKAHHTDPLCAACLAQVVADDRDAEIYEAMEAPARGAKH